MDMVGHFIGDGCGRGGNLGHALVSQVRLFVCLFVHACMHVLVVVTTQSLVCLLVGRLYSCLGVFLFRLAIDFGKTLISLFPFSLPNHTNDALEFKLINNKVLERILIIPCTAVCGTWRGWLGFVWPWLL